MDIHPHVPDVSSPVTIASVGIIIAQGPIRPHPKDAPEDVSVEDERRIACEAASLIGRDHEADRPGWSFTSDARSKRFELTTEQRSLIERKISEYGGGDSPEVARRAAASARALPLYLDWSACMAMRPDGELIWVDYGEPHPVRVVEDERERNVGRYQGGRNDPDLRWLIPTRPADARDCPDCRGTGRVSLPGSSEHLAGRVVCPCGGTGWLPAAIGTPEGRRSKRRSLFIRVLLLFGATPPLLLALSLIGIFAWSGLNSWRDDIDINSGRVRSSRSLFWVEGPGCDPGFGPDEGPVSRGSGGATGRLAPGRHPLAAATLLAALPVPRRDVPGRHAGGRMGGWQPDPEARRETALQVTRLWRETKGDFQAGEYINSVAERAMEAEDGGKAIGKDDLLMP